MPHAEIKYSSDLQLDSAAILAEIETIILRHDGGAGACKGRAYPTDEFHHSHVTVSVSLLVKPHRDAAFSAALLSALEQAVSAMLPRPCEFSFGLHYSTPHYVTRSLKA
ncbi:hypothetical protein [Pseudophaeobacter sp.]|jgi:hypothetical protein|uniref:5-carboxymethyl-2-hydroxymuconate isomerase n=1 Tax=Pseudophaeobacter arcticus TaxID=385492 RepID=A0ABQ0AIT0_9RHOB|nr:hypothetical protein [uncultured Pseudophaeobacter sp.]UWS80159.1 hypothetical protein N1037_03785 [Phaeobacter sp. G2]